jgi:hypothetical protein
MDAWVAVPGLRRREIDLRLIDRGQPGERRGLGERESEAPGATADFEHLFAIRNAGVLDKRAAPGAGSSGPSIVRNCPRRGRYRRSA